MNNERTEHALQLQLRKKQSNLAAVGLGVIAFGVWSVIKTVLYTALDANGALSIHAGEPYFLLAFWILLGGALAVDLALRVHIGRCAIAEGRGEKRKPGYIVLALLMAVFSFAGLAAGLFMMDASADIESALDLGLFAYTLQDIPPSYIMLYLLITHLFAGVIGVLRAREARRMEGRWKLSLAIGMANILLAAACCFCLRRLSLLTYVYTAGLVYSACLRMVQAFQRSAIIYIP